MKNVKIQLRSKEELMGDAQFIYDNPATMITSQEVLDAFSLLMAKKEEVFIGEWDDKIVTQDCSGTITILPDIDFPACNILFEKVDTKFRIMYKRQNEVYRRAHHEYENENDNI